MAQHDQVIDNGPGLAVRTDINAALAALFSSNSGPVEPGTRVPGQFWFDTANPDAGRLWMRDQANVAWVPVFDVNDTDIGFGKRDTPDRFVWNDRADLSGRDIMTLEPDTGILSLAGFGTGAVDVTLQSSNGQLRVAGAPLAIDKITVSGTGTTPKNYMIESVNGVLDFGTAAGDGMARFDAAQVEKTMGFLGTGTTPQNYTIQSINGVLLVQGAAGAIMQLSGGLTVGQSVSVGGNLAVTGMVSAGAGGFSSATGGVSAGNQIATTSSVRGNTGIYGNSDATLGMVVSGATRYMMMIGTTWAFNCNGANGDCSWMQPGGYNWFARAGDAAFIIRGQGYKPGGGNWADASDARIKTVLGNYESGLEQILALQPVRYMFKGNDTPGPPTNKPDDPIVVTDEETGAMTVQEPPENTMAEEPPTVPYWNSPHRKQVEDETELIGLIAQNTEMAMPEMVTRATAYIDGIEVNDMRNLDTSPLVFALINAVKTLAERNDLLQARIEKLEAV